MAQYSQGEHQKLFWKESQNRSVCSFPIDLQIKRVILRVVSGGDVAFCRG
jgi:hypothetical protein